MKLTWNVFLHDVNRKSIDEFNIFDHFRFNEDVKKNLKKCKTKEEFSEILRRDLSYYFRFKSEYEIVITSLTTSISKEELSRLVSESDSFQEKYGHKPYYSHVELDVGRKVDIYSQVMLNYDIFVNYVWSHKRSKHESNKE